MAWEVNFDGIVGPTHNYSGLSYGNVASMHNRYSPSNPKEAALQGLEKMKFLADLGLKQAVMPPHERPHLPTLRALGFSGSDAQVIAAAARQAPDILVGCSSAAAMWCANAATVCPSADSADGLVHFTAANLTSKFHRSIEPQTTAKFLQAVFKDPAHFRHHAPLPAAAAVADEGAANHMRLCAQHGAPGVQVFVYGRHGFAANAAIPKRFPARHTREASAAIARLHALAPARTVFVQQHPLTIDAGAFHNDVVAVSNETVLFFHESAFAGKEAAIDEIKQKAATCGAEVVLLEVKEQDLSLHDAIATYLFNSQIVTLPNGRMAILAPTECQDNARVKSLLEHIASDPANPIDAVHYSHLRQSMSNGGGPACLRLRAVLTPQELGALHPHVLLDDTLYDKLTRWVHAHYRDRLDAKDLAAPALADESRQALDALTQILQLGSLYSFQRTE